MLLEEERVTIDTPVIIQHLIVLSRFRSARFLKRWTHTENMNLQQIDVKSCLT